MSKEFFYWKNHLQRHVYGTFFNRKYASNRIVLKKAEIAFSVTSDFASVNRPLMEVVPSLQVNITMISVGYDERSTPKEIRSFLIQRDYLIYKIDPNEDYFVQKSFLNKSKPIRQYWCDKKFQSFICGIVESKVLFVLFCLSK